MPLLSTCPCSGLCAGPSCLPTFPETVSSPGQGRSNVCALCSQRRAGRVAGSQDTLVVAGGKRSSLHLLISSLKHIPRPRPGSHVVEAETPSAAEGAAAQGRQGGRWLKSMAGQWRRLAPREGRS